MDMMKWFRKKAEFQVVYVLHYICVKIYIRKANEEEYKKIMIVDILKQWVTEVYPMQKSQFFDISFYTCMEISLQIRKMFLQFLRFLSLWIRTRILIKSISQYLITCELRCLMPFLLSPLVNANQIISYWASDCLPHCLYEFLSEIWLNNK